MTRKSWVAAGLAALCLLSGCADNAPSATTSAYRPAPSTTARPIAAPHAASAVVAVGPKATRGTAPRHAGYARTARGAGVRAALGAQPLLPACGHSGRPPTTYRHVIWIWLENRSYGTVIGPPGSAARRQAPYLNSLADSCGLATNYHNVSHPSQPNYFAAVAGTTGGVTTNCEPATCSLGNRPTLFSQLSDDGRQWRSYEESMASPCQSGNRGRYVDRHNPEVYFSSDHQQCLRWDVPLGDARTGALAQALAEDTLPAFSFVTPDVCDDMHSCATLDGDQWLAAWLPRIIDSPGYQAGDTAVFITFDEGEGGHSYRCADNTTDVGCHVPTVVVSPWTPVGTRSGLLFNHYSLLRTTEQLLGLPYLGQAADDDTHSMVTAFGL